MNKRQKKKYRKNLYKTLIEDVALEISLDAKWRRKILEESSNTKIGISYLDFVELPKYIRKEIVYNKLEFWVMKVDSCEEYFDDNLAIFKFQSKEYSEIVRFSGNNPNVI